MNASDLRIFQAEKQKQDIEYRNNAAISNADAVIEKIKKLIESADNFKYATALQCAKFFFGDNAQDVEKTIKDLQSRGFKIQKNEYKYTGSQVDDYFNNKDKLDYGISW